LLGINRIAGTNSGSWIMPNKNFIHFRAMRNPIRIKSDKNLLIAVSILAFGIFLGGVVGCTKVKYKPSGFLNNYSNLKPHPTDEGFYSYENPKKDLSNYSRFYVQHVVVVFSDDSIKRGVDPTKINELSEYLRNQIIRALEDKYTLTGFGQRQPGTVAIGIAITDLKPKEKDSGGASMEYKLVDYATNEIIMAGVITQTLSGDSNQSEWTPTRTLFDQWAARLRARLDEVHNKQKP
jgi:hypothetical protein